MTVNMWKYKNTSETNKISSSNAYDVSGEPFRNL